MVVFSVLEWIFKPRKKTKELAEKTVDGAIGVVAATAKGYENAKNMLKVPVTAQQSRYQLARLYVYGAAILSFGLVYWIASMTTGWVFWIYLVLVMALFHFGFDKQVASDLAQWFYARSRGAKWEVDPVRDRDMIEQESERRILEMLPVLKQFETMNPRQRRRRSPELLMQFGSLIGGRLPKVAMPPTGEQVEGDGSKAQGGESVSEEGKHDGNA